MTADKAKYEFTGEEQTAPGGAILRRIRAARDFSDVKAGDLGGWIESEFNLSQEGNCWVYDKAVVFKSAQVKENATVRDLAYVSGNAVVGRGAGREGGELGMVGMARKPASSVSVSSVAGSVGLTVLIVSLAVVLTGAEVCSLQRSTGHTLRFIGGGAPPQQADVMHYLVPHCAGDPKENPSGCPCDCIWRGFDSYAQLKGAEQDGLFSVTPDEPGGNPPVARKFPSGWCPVPCPPERTMRQGWNPPEPKHLTYGALIADFGGFQSWDFVCQGGRP